LSNVIENFSILSEKTFESLVRHLMAEFPISINRLDWDIKKR